MPKIRTGIIVIALSLVGALSVSCTENETSIGAEPNTGGTSGQGATTGAGGALSDAGPDVPAATACPQGLAGPKLIAVPAPDGSFYCMDQREVVNSEYQEFLKAVAGKAPNQPPECSWNTAFSPELYDPFDPNYDGLGTDKCAIQIWNNDPTFAVVCVDFCDAWAYCAWAGKRLCGVLHAPNKVSALTKEQASSVAKSTQSEWFNACSQAGTTKFPYGDSYVAGRCVDQTKITADGNQARSTKEITNSTCSGTKAPFGELHHLSGNAVEWLNICADGGKTCAHQGGARSDEQSSSLACESFGAVYAGSINAYQGFRCCADAVAPPGL